MEGINPYLNFPGTAEAAFKFYKSVFGGEFATVQRFKDTPEGGKLSDQDKEKIMHIALPIGKGNVLMATDAIESMGHKVHEGNNFHLAINVGSKGEADTIFKNLSAGGTASVPMQEMFWGAYFGMLKDKFGIQWMISYDPKTH